MNRTIKKSLIVALLVLAACAVHDPTDPCEGRYDEWYCQLQDCQPDPAVIPEAELEWPLDRRIPVNWIGGTCGYDPELHCLKPEPSCCPPDWFECEDLRGCVEVDNPWREEEEDGE